MVERDFLGLTSSGVGPQVRTPILLVGLAGLHISLAQVSKISKQSCLPGGLLLLLERQSASISLVRVLPQVGCHCFKLNENAVRVTTIILLHEDLHREQVCSPSKTRTRYSLSQA